MLGRTTRRWTRVSRTLLHNLNLVKRSIVVIVKWHDVQTRTLQYHSMYSELILNVKVAFWQTQQARCNFLPFTLSALLPTSHSSILFSSVLFSQKSPSLQLLFSSNITRRQCKQTVHRASASTTTLTTPPTSNLFFPQKENKQTKPKQTKTNQNKPSTWAPSSPAYAHPPPPPPHHRATAWL